MKEKGRHANFKTSLKTIQRRVPPSHEGPYVDQNQLSIGIDQRWGNSFFVGKTESETRSERFKNGRKPEYEVRKRK